MPNSKFFVGSYSGDVSNRNANYTSCDWASAVSASYQSQQPSSVRTGGTCGCTEPTNPYVYAKQPVAVTSNYYASLPVTNPCDCVEEPVIPECPSIPECPVYPECPTVPDAPSCDCPSEPVMPECPRLPDDSSCGCHSEPTVPECPVFPECSTTSVVNTCGYHDAVEPVIADEAMPFANFRPRRRNRIPTRDLGTATRCGTQECAQAINEVDDCADRDEVKRRRKHHRHHNHDQHDCSDPTAVEEATSCPVTPMPKRKHCGCNCAPKQEPTCTAQTQPSCHTQYTGRCVDIPEDDDCQKHKKEKCFFYEKLKHYHRKGKTICDFLTDYDEETFYAIIGD